MWYVGGHLSSTPMHVENCCLPAANLLLAGRKWWLVVDVFHRAELMAAVAELFKGKKMKNACPSILDHNEYVLLTKLLDKWHIRYTLLVQEPGDLVLLRGGAYHLVFNEGLTVAEAVNFGSFEWSVTEITDYKGNRCKQCRKKVVHIPRER